jgi:hypothetical protein
MPTITIIGPDLPARRRRAIAVRLTRWFTDRGVAAAHVITRFQTCPPGTFLSGGLPVEALRARPPAAEGDGTSPHSTSSDGTSPGLPFAAVTCQVAPDRDAEFKDALAAEIHAALGADDRTAFFYLEFRVTSPADVYVAAAGEPRRLGPSTPIEQPTRARSQTP